MMFLFRVAFWLSLVILLLPADPKTSDAPSVSAFEALGAARAAMADVSGFCERNPTVCSTGSAVADLMARKARYGARMVSDYLDGLKGSDAKDGTATVSAKPGATQAPMPAAIVPASGTLTKDDLTTPWRGPKQTAGVAG